MRVYTGVLCAAMCRKGTKEFTPNSKRAQRVYLRLYRYQSSLKSGFSKALYRFS